MQRHSGLDFTSCRLAELLFFTLLLVSPFIRQARAQSHNVFPPQPHFESRPAQPPQTPPQATPQPVSPAFGGTWQTATPALVGLLNNPLLLTDGTVIALEQGTSNWYKLTPDALGNYATGTWSQIASMPSGYEPLDFASAVLPDGRVLVEGGECNTTVTPCTQSVWSSLGAIYDPVGNAWTSVSPPSGTGWINTDAPGNCNGGIGDAQGIVLPSGIFMLGASCAYPPVDALFDATTLSWSGTGAPLYYQDEQGYTLLQNGKVLTLDLSDFQYNTATNMTAEAYDPGTGIWSSIASVPVLLTDPMSCYARELGPTVTRPDGTVVAFGGIFGSCVSPTADPTAIYNPTSNTWTEGPTIPTINGAFYSLADAPAALLPDGNILFAASPGFQTAPTHFFEFTAANAINQVADDVYYASDNSAYELNFLVLPSGQILATDYSQYVEIYTPTGSPNSSWAPTVASAPSCVTPGSTYVLSGTQLNGLSQGAAYGDDFQAATNYPLVRIVNTGTGHVFYARTFGFNSTSIAPGHAGSTSFKVAAATETGASTLYLVANGIASTGTPVTVRNSCSALIDAHDLNGDGKSDVVWENTSGNLAAWLMNGGTVSQSAGLGTVPLSFSIIGQHDFNGDGNADVLWRDSSGNVSIWFMNGTAVASAAAVGNLTSNWTLYGTGDLNGDGKGDLLWRDSNTGTVAIWFMNGATVASTAVFGALPSNWTIVGDANGDILWRDNVGDIALWGVQNGQVTTSSGLGTVTSNFVVQGIGDFNGDGDLDLLWRDANTGVLSIWFTNGAQVTSAGSVGTLPSNWSVAQIGDYNGDGKSDILLLDSAGDLAVWLMNGSIVSSSLPISNVGPTWQVQNLNDN